MQDFPFGWTLQAKKLEGQGTWVDAAPVWFLGRWWDRLLVGTAELACRCFSA